MTRFAAKISFVGTNYHGWQVQNNAKSVQGEIESALSTLFRVKTPVVGCGRTDAGVHASYFILHFDADTKLACDSICFKVNAILPKDIAFHDLRPVDKDFHARFHATKRSYQYFLHFGKKPFLLDLSMPFWKDLNVEAMNVAAKSFLGEQDFSSLTKAHGGNHTFICNVTEAYWEKVDDKQLVFNVSANRFLRNMVRAMVGTLLKVGLEKESPDFVNKVLAAKDRSVAGESVKACGLYLSNVVYPSVFND